VELVLKLLQEQADRTADIQVPRNLRYLPGEEIGQNPGAGALHSRVLWIRPGIALVKLAVFVGRESFELGCAHARRFID
jgi:hypothetical protein